MLTITLKDYQNEPVDKFLYRGNLLCAFDVGLGKTPIGVACAEELLGCGDATMIMVVCPATLRTQWAQKIAEYTDVPTVQKKLKQEVITIPAESHCVIIDGKPEKRQKKYREIMRNRPEYVILSYDNVLDDKITSRLKPDMVILDEASAIKTFKAERTKRVKKILKAPYRLALTATSVENYPEELYSIMQWVDETVLGRFDLFDKAYIVRESNGRVKRYKNLNVLRKRLEPAFCRVSHADVAEHVPEAHRQVMRISLDDQTWEAYSTIAYDLLVELEKVHHTGSFDVVAHYSGKPDESTHAGKVMARMQAAERLLCHPDLIVISAMEYEESQRQIAAGAQKKTWPGSRYAYQVWQSGLVDDLTHSPKLDRLAEQVRDILAENDEYKILIYSQYIPMLEIIASVIDAEYVLHHGNMTNLAKEEAKARFRNNPHVRVFISSHSGSYGTDMPMASHLIKYDLPWSFGKDHQINGRHIRVSSKFDDVYIIDMITTPTIETWKKDEVLAHKERVARAIQDGDGIDARGRVDNKALSLTAYLTETV